MRRGAVSRREFFSLLAAGSVCGLIAASVVAMLFAGVVEALRRGGHMQHVSPFELVVVGLSALLGLAGVGVWQDLGEPWKPSHPNRELPAAAGVKSRSVVVQAADAAKENCRA